MDDDAFESLCLRFEEAWARGGPCPIASFLGASTTDRERLLTELIAIDLEFRWRRSPGQADSPPRWLLEDYVATFPELGPLDRIAPELIGEEYRVRRRWGDRPTHQDFLTRFPVYAETLRGDLRRIDHELERESADHRPPVGASSGSVPIELASDLPRLSHRDLLLRRLIGAGGIGKVYRAWQHSAAGDVAVKFLRKSLLRDSRVVRRFLGEAGTVADLSHPGIVSTRGVGRTDGGSIFIVMDLVDGPDLSQLAQTRPIRVDAILRWTLEACQALEHAHDRGVIHCDLKPANLLLDASGTIRVTDFGLARSLAGPSPEMSEIEGTAPFMAPEQVSPSWGPIDQRTDVYGIGAVLFALLTGRPPHQGRRLPDVLADVVGARPVVSPEQFCPDLPTPIVAFCRRCLAKPPRERYPTMREARLALLDLIG